MTLPAPALPGPNGIVEALCHENRRGGECLLCGVDGNALNQSQRGIKSESGCVETHALANLRAGTQARPQQTEFLPAVIPRTSE